MIKIIKSIIAILLVFAGIGILFYGYHVSYILNNGGWAVGGTISGSIFAAAGIFVAGLD